MLVITCIISKVSTNYMEHRQSCFDEVGQQNIGNNYFVYKTITCPIRADILDVYSNLKNWIVVLVDLAVICVKEWYLCKGHFAIRSRAIV